MIEAENDVTETTNEHETVSAGKTIAVVAYLTIIGLIIAFVLNNDKKNAFAAYHIRQSLGLALTGLVMGALNVIPIIGWLINLVGFFILFFMWFMGLIKAVNGKKEPVPILGEKYEQWFSGL